MHPRNTATRDNPALR